VITGSQLKAARALLGIGQRELARISGLSLPTIQRMEACEGTVRGTVESLMKVVDALQHAGVELIGEGAESLARGRGVRLALADTR
jgi:transcriptional regulator with XRE-family HTH domain